MQGDMQGEQWVNLVANVILALDDFDEEMARDTAFHDTARVTEHLFRELYALRDLVNGQVMQAKKPT